GSLTVKFGTGPDAFEYTGLFNSHLGSVTLNMGLGDDVASMSNFFSPTVTINQAKPTLSATDNDTTNVFAGGPYIGGGLGTLTINNYGGRDTTTLNVGTRGPLQVHNADGGDTT